MKYTNKTVSNFYNELMLDDIVIIGDDKHTTVVYDADGLKKNLSNYHYKILTGIFDQEECDHVRVEYDAKTFKIKHAPNKKMIWHTKQ